MVSERRAAFRDWRRSRPFWAGICAIAAGLVILFPPYASLKFGDMVVSLNTFTGMSAIVIGIVLACCGLSFWFRPEFRTGAGVLTLLLAIVAVVTANFGSFLIGTMLGVVGASLAIAWTPKPKPARAKAPSHARPQPQSPTQSYPTIAVGGGDA